MTVCATEGEGGGGGVIYEELSVVSRINRHQFNSVKLTLKLSLAAIVHFKIDAIYPRHVTMLFLLQLK